MNAQPEAAVTVTGSVWQYARPAYLTVSQAGRQTLVGLRESLLGPPSPSHAKAASTQCCGPPGPGPPLMPEFKVARSLTVTRRIRLPLSR